MHILSDIYSITYSVNSVLWYLLFICWRSCTFVRCTVSTRDGKEPGIRKNEQNKYPGFAKNRTEPEAGSKERAKPEPNRTWTQMSWFLLGSFIDWSCRYIHTFHSKRRIFHYVGWPSSSTSLMIINTILDLCLQSVFWYLQLHLIRIRWNIFPITSMKNPNRIRNFGFLPSHL